MKQLLTIRTANPGESALLSDLAYRSKASWGYDNQFMSACRHELTVTADDILNPQRAYVICEYDNNVAGFYALDRISDTVHELEALFVEPRLLRRGIGRALINHALVSAREAGARSILIQGDPNAAEFYEAVGAEQIGERESESIPGRFLPEFVIGLKHTDSD